MNYFTENWVGLWFGAKNSFIHSLLSVIDKRKKWYLSRRFHHLDNEAAAVDGDGAAAEEQPYSRSPATRTSKRSLKSRRRRRKRKR